MAHFAQLDAEDIVVQVITVHNNELLDENGQESEGRGIAFCQSLFGADTVWVQTSYNGSFRKNFAGIGFKYDRVRDAFIRPQPFPSWVFVEETCNWTAPVLRPEPGAFIWNEETVSWDPL